MKTTTPIAQARSSSARSELGLFAAEDLQNVVRNIRADLVAYNVTIEGLLSKYTRAVKDIGRQERAQTVIADLLEDKLTPSDAKTVIEVLYFAGYQRLLAKHHLRFPAYNVLDEYFTNATYPWGPVILPRPRAGTRRWSLFGRQIGFPMGVPASVLTDNARWIQHFANNGFNVLTYRTVRTRPHQPFEAPNWAFVPDHTTPFALGAKPGKVVADPWDWVDPGERDITTTNSFGVPASSPSEWAADIANALDVLGDDQLLLVSVLGEDYDALDKKSRARLDIVAADFAEAAWLAEDAGAEVVELNLSCPNSMEEGQIRRPLCEDVERVAAVVEAVRGRISSRTKLVAKLSYLDEDTLAELVLRIAEHVDGIAGINTLQCEVKRTDGAPLFPGRANAGVSGIAIRDHALDFIGRLVRLRVECGRYFEIIGMGGVTDSASFEAMYLLGANAVQTASGAFANPFLAAECIGELGETLPTTADIADKALSEAIEKMILDEATRRGHVSRSEVAAALPLRASQAFRILDGLESRGKLRRDIGLYGEPVLTPTAY